jgi:hypothetical protein
MLCLFATSLNKKTTCPSMNRVTRLDEFCLLGDCFLIYVEQFFENYKSSPNLGYFFPQQQFWFNFDKIRVGLNLGQFLITFSSGRPVHEVHHCETLTKAVASNLRLGTQLTGSSAISKCFASSVYTGAISALKKMIRLRFFNTFGAKPFLCL